MPRSPDSSDEGRIEIEMSGPWAEAIFWEVPLLATLSEIYLTTVDKDWDYEGQAGTSPWQVYLTYVGGPNTWVCAGNQNALMRKAPSCSRRAARLVTLARVAGALITLTTL